MARKSYAKSTYAVRLDGDVTKELQRRATAEQTTVSACQSARWNDPSRTIRLNGLACRLASNPGADTHPDRQRDCYDRRTSHRR